LIRWWVKSPREGIRAWREKALERWAKSYCGSSLNGRIYFCKTDSNDQVAVMNYWERQKSFWKTPWGMALYFLILITLLTGGLLALNLLSSPFPVIETFRAGPLVIGHGESTNLSWSVVGAERVEIDQGIGAVDGRGSWRVSPEKTTAYTLTAINGTRIRSAEARVVVEQ
jgi:hypothetical protein